LVILNRIRGGYDELEIFNYQTMLFEPAKTDVKEQQKPLKNNIL